MKAITSLTALVLGASLAGAALAQTGTGGDTPPAQAGAGAAAAVSGNAPAQGQTPQDAPDATDAAGTDDATADTAQKPLPEGVDITPDHTENGRWYNAEGIPTFKIEDDGTVDFATFNGYRRYSAECHVCHGPDGEGSTYAPALKESVLRMDYYDFQQIVASGRQQVNAAQNQVMPAFGTNRNVWCYIDDIYAYLLARGTDQLPRGRPARKGPKTDEFAAQEDSCMSM